MVIDLLRIGGGESGRDLADDGVEGEVHEGEETVQSESDIGVFHEGVAMVVKERYLKLLVDYSMKRHLVKKWSWMRRDIWE